MRGVGNEGASSQDGHAESFIKDILVWLALLTGMLLVDVRCWFWVAVCQAERVKNVLNIICICASECPCLINKTI